MKIYRYMRSVGRGTTPVVRCGGANGPEKRSVPRLFLQPRAERTSARPRGPRRSVGKVLASAFGARAEFRLSAEGTAENQRADRREPRKPIGGMAWAYWR